MAVKSFEYIPGLAVDTERGPSQAIWGVPGNPGGYVADFIERPRLGMYFWEDFKNCGISPATGSAGTFGAENSWYGYGDTAGVITDAGIVGGGITLGGGTTDNAGIAISSLTNSYQIVTASGTSGVMQGRLCFETRVAMSAASYVVTRNDMFVGLVDASGLPAAAMPITATDGVLSTAPGLIGFHKRGGTTNGADWNFVYQVAGGTAVYAANLLNLITTVTGVAPVGGTYYKLGFVFDPNPQLYPITSASTGQTASGNATKALIQIYVNGLRAVAFLTSTNVTGTSFPITIMAPSIAYRNQNTTAALSGSVDWIGIGQNAIT